MKKSYEVIATGYLPNLDKVGLDELGHIDADKLEFDIDYIEYGASQSMNSMVEEGGGGRVTFNNLDFVITDAGDLGYVWMLVENFNYTSVDVAENDIE